MNMGMYMGVFPLGHFDFVYNPNINDMFYGLEYGKKQPEEIIEGYSNQNLLKGIKLRKELIIYAPNILYVPEDMLDEVLELL